MTTDEWLSLYAERWRGDIVPEAYAHPAKMARGLTRRIYDHLRDEGWTVPGATVLDPFGGIAGTALEAMLHGLRWRGVELEPRFVALGNQNLDLWRSRYAALPGFCGDATLVQGDSRRLGEALRGAGACVSSPPFSDSIGTKDQAFWDNHNDRQRNWNGATREIQDYGSTSGNLGNLRATDAGFSAAVASPPYADAVSKTKPDVVDDRPFSTKFSKSDLASRSYGSHPGQLGAMRAAVSSPPFGTGDSAGPESLERRTDKSAEWCKKNQKWRVDGTGQGSPGNLALTKTTDDDADDFWSAARLIVQQTHAALAPGAHAVWVVKAFVRNKALVDFPGQWRALCESVGFTTLHEHHALLTEHRGAQHALDGSTLELTTERKSFFRRLAERKGSPRIDWETIYCMERP